MKTAEIAAAPPSAVQPDKGGWKRGFWSLFITQFQGAFSDNAFKSLVIFLIIGSSFPGNERDRLVLIAAIAGSLFSLPFILFSMTGGYLADRWSKRSVTIGTKVLEVLVMLLALVSLALNNLPMELGALFLMGTQSAFFGPSKYGLLPELLPEKRLSWGNGVIELGTMMALISGTVAAGWLAETFRGRQEWSGAILVGLAVVGLIASFGIDRVPAADRTKRFRANFIGDLMVQIRLARKDRVLLLAVIGNTYFWFLAALLHLNIVFYGTEILRARETENSYLQASLAIGVGLGSLTVGYLSGRKIEYGLIPLGSLGLTAFAAAISRGGASFNAAVVNLGLLGFFGGFFFVPIAALLQHRPEKENKGGVIAASNLLAFVGVFLASGVYYFLARVANLDPRQIFLASAAVTLGGTAYVLFLMPHALLRLVLWLWTHSLYRIRVEGRDNIPDKGGALFASNHLSMIDSLLLLASTDRFVRFIMSKEVYDLPWVKPFARVMRAIPVSSPLRPREMVRSLREASDSIKGGDVVSLFPEGQVTRIGQMLPFRRSIERIMKDVQAPIIPVSLDGVWGSIFSFERGRFFWKVPRRIPYPVTVSYGKPMPATSTALEVRQAIQDLQSESWRHRRRQMLTLHRSFLRTARRYPLRFAMADAQVPRLRFASALARTVFVARRLKKVWEGQKMVGILLPPSVAGALVNLAALLMGKVPVNLNYTLSNDALASCARQCELRAVVSSRAFLDRMRINVPGPAVLLEELLEKPRILERLMACLMAWTFPAGLLEKSLGRGKKVALDDLATVIFSSGSTGDPKGVMLTHYNIGSNIEQFAQTFALERHDRFLGSLPFFHSFGFTGTLLSPAVLGVGVVYHKSPLETEAIGALVLRYKVTYLVSTPTFLQMYIRCCSPEAFGSLECVLVGAEKLPERLSRSFEDAFGIRPLEAYGCTECSPAVAVSRRDFRGAGYRQVGFKRGSIGHPLPGVSVRIVDPETLDQLPVHQAGLLLVRGPNVMKGYLGRPDDTARVLRDGWYLTGDIGTLDDDGFLTITDRLSRFSKIGGEMVPHLKIEEMLQELAGGSEQRFAVAGVPDEEKGERLVVLHTLGDHELQACLDKLAQVDLPNLWIPRRNQFFRIEAMPYLGTGKLDLRKVRDLALTLSAPG